MDRESDGERIDKRVGSSREWDRGWCGFHQRDGDKKECRLKEGE